MNSKPLVSIIVPCYNSQETISRCLKSVLSQDYPFLEVIVVDDGSNDRTYEIVSKENNVTLLRQENKGAPSARNFGLSVAKGRYIKYLDADDELLPGCISKQVRLLSRLPDEVIVYGDYLLCEGDNEKYISTKLKYNNQVVGLFFQDILTTTPLHKKWMLDRINGFDVNLPRGQEWNLHIRLAASGARFVHDPGAVFRYVQDASSKRISSINRSKTTNEKLIIDFEREVLTHSQVEALLSSQMFWLRCLRFIMLASRAKHIENAEILGRAAKISIPSPFLRKVYLSKCFPDRLFVRWFRLFCLITWRNTPSILRDMKAGGGG
jgi:glycosyltransferase involved in cell wall biosynthesis